jgi:hypothetical protein
MVLPFGLERFQPEGNLLKRLVPGGLFPPALAPFSHSPQGSWDAIRVVKVVQPCNPFGAEPAATIRIERISTDVDDFSIF